LHPEWQIKFAELLVMLQKELNLTLLITTHSIDFLDAIEVSSREQGTEEKCRFYLTEEHGDTCDANEKTEDRNAIYTKLAKPFDELEKRRYALSAKKEENNE
jgi:AAA15 family ATPase/GTPase